MEEPEEGELVACVGDAYSLLAGPGWPHGTRDFEGGDLCRCPKSGGDIGNSWEED